MNNVIIVAGPTASGKTRLSLRIAAFLKDKCGLDSEIINADSIQLYRDLKILTAHPSSSEMSTVAHNLFGILAPHESSSVAFWLHKARNIIENLQSHNKIAIICGGTGFYIRAITNGIASIPKIPEDVRRMVREEFAVLGRDRFLEKLSVLDSNMAQMLHKNDTQRILRAYEVVYFTGKSLSEWWRLSGEEPSRNIKTFFLSPDRDKLNELCRRRVQKMMCDGVADEFADFIRQYPEYNGPLRNAVGYADLERFINGDLPAAECIENIFIETRRYAKRQYTWFRNKLSGTLVLDGSSRDNDVITIHLEKIFRT